MMDKIYARPSLPAEFGNVTKGAEVLRWRSNRLERWARHQLGCLVAYECVEVDIFTDFVRAFGYVPLLSKRFFVKVLLRNAALLSSYIQYSGSSLCKEASNKLWIFLIRNALHLALVIFWGTHMITSNSRISVLFIAKLSKLETYSCLLAVYPMPTSYSI